LTIIIYIELKGSDVEKAFVQLGSTISIYTERHSFAEEQCYIVASRIPKIGTKIQNLKQRFVT